MRGIGGWCAIPLFWLITVAFSAQWTIGVYMCADNGMNEQANSDIAEMMAVGSSGSVNIVVQVDYAAWDTNPSCRRYYIKKNQKELLADLGEVDMADSATLADFIAFLKKSFPARNYFLIIWDHGNGWRAGYGPRRAVVIDESHTHMMGVAGGELASALRLGKKMLGRKITVLGFDACLMGSIEVATEVMDYCDYLLASEGLVGWEGFPYDDFFGKIVANPAVTTEELLKEMCADYGKRNSGEDVCLSAIFLPQLPRVINRINALCSTLSAVGDLRLARERVQTFGIDASRPPAVTDEQIDFIHFWQLVPSAGGCGLSAVAPLLSALDSLIIANAAYGDYRNARGVAAWFPYRYLSFKAKAAEYQELVFADSTPWLWFLNNYYSRDDVKPTQPEILNHRTGNRNDIRLWWSKSYDLAPVTYILYRVTEPETVFFDCAADLNNWQTEGWTLSTRYFHSAPFAFFSGSAAGLNSELTLCEPLNLPAGGLLSFYACYLTEEGEDSLSNPVRDVCYLEYSSDRSNWFPMDSFYGTKEFWDEFRYILPPVSQFYLRFRYRTNGAINYLGVFIDDLKVERFSTSTSTSPVKDTTFYLFNLPRDTTGYYFLVVGVDSFGNFSSVSDYYQVKIKTFAEPYTRPAPFADRCKIVLDFPKEENPDVLIFTLSGTLVKRFQRVTSQEIDWDGRQERGKEIADGVYIVVVKGRNFRKIGKIAKVRTSWI